MKQFFLKKTLKRILAKRVFKRRRAQIERALTKRVARQPIRVRQKGRTERSVLQEFKTYEQFRRFNKYRKRVGQRLYAIPTELRMKNWQDKARARA